MKLQDYKDYHWELPKNITMEELPAYTERLNKILPGASLTLDMTKTVNIHSSFIGFILNARNTLFKENGELRLQLSEPAEKIMTMLNLRDYFCTAASETISRKTA